MAPPREAVQGRKEADRLATTVLLTTHSSSNSLSSKSTNKAVVVVDVAAAAAAPAPAAADKWITTARATWAATRQPVGRVCMTMSRSP